MGKDCTFYCFPKLTLNGVVDIEGYCQGSGDYFLGCKKGRGRLKILERKKFKV